MRLNVRMSFLVVSIIILSMITVINQTEAATHDHVNLMIDGQYEKPEVPARISDGRTVVPLRFIAEKMGAEVEWIPETRGIIIEKNHVKLKLWIDSKEILVNEERQEIDVAPFIENDRTLVPIRFVSEYLGLRVGWDADRRDAIISEPIQFLLNGQALPNHLKPIKIHHHVYFPVFDLANLLNVEVTESRNPDLYTFSRHNVHQNAIDNRSGNEQSVDHDSENDQNEGNGQLIQNQIPASQVRTIDGVKMVSSIFINPLLGTTSTWDEQQNIYNIHRDIEDFHSLNNELTGISLENGVFTIHQRLRQNLDYNYFNLKSPDRIVIDLDQTVLSDQIKERIATGENYVIPVNHEIVERVRVGQFSTYPNVVRVVLDLKKRGNINLFDNTSELKFTVEERNVLVVIDPGHGGHDPGAIGSRSKERDVNLAISKKIVQLLENDPLIDVMITRTDNDTYVSLDDRVEFANNAQADLFLSVHANAINRSSVGGTETFIHYNANPAFGEIVHRHLIGATQLTDRGLKVAGFRVIRGTSMPAVLIEVAFMSNPHEEQLLNQEEFQNRVAHAMYQAIREYEFGK